MQINLFGIEIKIGKPEQKAYEKAAKIKQETAINKIYAAIKEIELKQLKYSEYRLQKISGVSINTIKKYRKQIAEYRKQLQSNNLSQP